MIPAAKQTKIPELQANLRGLLAQVDEEAFLRAIWALDAIHLDPPQAALMTLENIPPEAIGSGIAGQKSIYPWEMESLVNEMLAAPWFPYKRSDINDWGFYAHLAGLLRHLDDAESGVRRERINIFVELGRIAARQFEWQRGFTNVASFYRSAYIFGNSECAEYFMEKHGLAIADFMFLGFAVRAASLSHASIRISDLAIAANFGLGRSSLRQGLNLLAAKLCDAQDQAQKMRGALTPVSYRPSVLRRFPCLWVGGGHRRLAVPLPELVVDRVTSGLFYDLVGGSGKLRDEYGKRFEAYCHSLLSKSIADMRFKREWSYSVSRKRYISPDLVEVREGEIHLVIECKAARMPIDARFGDRPSEVRGYEEMAKGLTQIWRFIAHARKGAVGVAIGDQPLGMLITLDDWFMLRPRLAEEVFERAHQIADEEAIAGPSDRIPVAIASISELENVCQRANRTSLIAAVSECGNPQKIGWHFSFIHDQFAGTVPQRPFPFEDDIAEMLPWWGQLREVMDETRD